MAHCFHASGQFLLALVSPGMLTFLTPCPVYPTKPFLCTDFSLQPLARELLPHTPLLRLCLQTYRVGGLSETQMRVKPSMLLIRFQPAFSSPSLPFPLLFSSSLGMFGVRIVLCSPALGLWQ